MFELLPVNTRLRCIEMSRAWRSLLADPSFWVHIDLSCVWHKRLTTALFRAAVAKAGTQLQVLDLTGNDLPFDVLHTTVVRGTTKVSCSTLTRGRWLSQAANADTPKELHFALSHYSAHELLSLLDAAPNLTELVADSAGSLDDARWLLSDPVFSEVVTIQDLRVDDAEMLHDDASVAAFCALVAKHHGMQELYLTGANLSTAAAARSVVDVALSLQLSDLYLEGCELRANSLPALGRLVSAGFITVLAIHNEGVPLLRVGCDATHMFYDALRTSNLDLLDLGGAGDDTTSASAIVKNLADARRAARQ